jgi:hypothetical protein
MQTLFSALLPLLFAFSFFACNSGADSASGNQPAAAQTTVNEPETQTAKQELRFVLADQTVSKGDTLCVDVTVRDFTQILSMQYTMNWNPQTLQFLKLHQFKLKDLSANNFGFNRTAQGKIGTSWFDNDVKGISIPDGTPIYQVCFLATGEPGTKDQIFFSSDPVMIEISNSKEELLNLAFNRATITIQ